MNEKNFEYLSDQLKYTGFGEALQMELKQKLHQQETSFTLYHETYYEDRVARATLNFNKAKQGDLYFFNSYTIEVQKENIPDVLEHTFYMGKTGNITMKESYNLLMGRSVYKELASKEGHTYNAWVQIDFIQCDENENFKFKQYHQNYGYDLEATLDKYPIKELGNDIFKEDLLRSLKRGNLHQVTFLRGSEESKLFIEASPQFKTIGIYDQDLKKLDNRHYKDIGQVIVVYEEVGEHKKKSQLPQSSQDEQPREGSKRRQKRSSSL
jgi:hypothetical protein